LGHYPDSVGHNRQAYAILTAVPRLTVRIGAEIEKEDATYWRAVIHKAPWDWYVARHNPMHTVPMLKYRAWGTANSYREALDASEVALKKAIT
jgi:hypothetical protein